MLSAESLSNFPPFKQKIQVQLYKIALEIIIKKKQENKYKI